MFSVEQTSSGMTKQNSSTIMSLHSSPMLPGTVNWAPFIPMKSRVGLLIPAITARLILLPGQTCDKYTLALNTRTWQFNS